MTKIEVIKQFARQIASLEGFSLGDPVLVDEITFIPIVKHETPRDEREYLTLEEALNENLCKITDKGTEVAHILFENLSEYPILIEEGEIFQGMGTQDRIAIGTAMVEPHATIEISVKCVHAPHHLSSGALFGYGSKGSRTMLRELRSLKYAYAKRSAPASSISQTSVWSKVSEETASENVRDRSKYEEVVKIRQKRAESRFKDKIQFPDKTCGFAVITNEGKLGALEIHRSSRNFQIRKDSVLNTLEGAISWKKTGKGPHKASKEIVQKVFKQLSEISNEDAQKQIEIDGLVLNMAGISGEALTSTFYSGVCPNCGNSKPRRKSCPKCDFEEVAKEEVAYMSLM